MAGNYDQNPMTVAAAKRIIDANKLKGAEAERLLQIARSNETKGK
ncbi:MAG: hypothetical protein QM537_01495 [Candidatus Symbiobacter sp.]|nr:hypothetical protein [Candidatus Symbiobacter sp.]